MLRTVYMFGFVNLIWPTLILSFGPPPDQFLDCSLIKPKMPPQVRLWSFRCFFFVMVQPQNGGCRWRGKRREPVGRLEFPPPPAMLASKAGRWEAALRIKDMIEWQILRCFLRTSRRQRKLRRIRSVAIQADYLHQFGCNQSTSFLTVAFVTTAHIECLLKGRFIIFALEDIGRFFPTSQSPFAFFQHCPPYLGMEPYLFSFFAAFPFLQRSAEPE